MNEKPQPEEWNEWKENSITRKVFEFFQQEAVLRRQIIAEGSCKRDSVFETGEEYTKQLLAAEIYALIANLSYEDVFLEENE